MKRLLLAVIATLFIAGSASARERITLGHFARDLIISPGITCEIANVPENMNFSDFAQTVYALDRAWGPRGLYDGSSSKEHVE